MGTEYLILISIAFFSIFAFSTVSKPLYSAPGKIPVDDTSTVIQKYTSFSYSNLGVLAPVKFNFKLFQKQLNDFSMFFSFHTILSTESSPSKNQYFRWSVLVAQVIPFVPSENKKGSKKSA